MLLRFTSGHAFATGAATYIYRPATAFEVAPRIHLRISLGGLATQAFMDTGGIYLICPPDIGMGLRLFPEDSMDSLRMLLRGVAYLGDLHRVPLYFPADEGEPLQIEVTAFVPRLEAGISWPEDLPCILGMSGCMERLRFAIDPLTDTFYFGELIP